MWSSFNIKLGGVGLANIVTSPLAGVFVVLVSRLLH
jgi:hypothetical protein